MSEHVSAESHQTHENGPTIAPPTPSRMVYHFGQETQCSASTARFARTGEGRVGTPDGNKGG